MNIKKESQINLSARQFLAGIRNNTKASRRDCSAAAGTCLVWELVPLAFWRSSSYASAARSGCQASVARWWRRALHLAAFGGQRQRSVCICCSTRQVGGLGVRCVDLTCLCWHRPCRKENAQRARLKQHMAETSSRLLRAAETSSRLTLVRARPKEHMPETSSRLLRAAETSSRLALVSKISILKILF